MSHDNHGRKTLKALSSIPASTHSMPYTAIQLSNSYLQEPLSDAGRYDETLLYVDDRELSRLLFEKIGNADIPEGVPEINEEFFYLVGLRKAERAAGAGHPKIEDMVVYRCVTARSAWL